MGYFNLPISTQVNKIVPKNAFDSYTTAKQKKLFVDKVGRITWVNKLSRKTTNLETKEIQEIQIFEIELKSKSNIKVVLDTIDKSIPYPIIFLMRFNSEAYLSSSTKHPNPLNEDNSVIDWTFKTNWFNPEKKKFCLNLKKNLDYVFKDFCVQLSGKPDLRKKSLKKIVEYEKQIDTVEKEILRLKAALSKMKQFNKKVELNTELNIKKQELLSLNDKL
ncbi:DUF4391 domain-containing protein [Pseudozobellia sp. WGM2]|uniref:DUF4391 domain-containing protein n=1 Tax=Pseudozobellia sp. WGM2 TaxID=2787625 RepID=UPI001AE00BA5|nr:DUF4391 domain-containing protein [Pseudozobellia sp. WGM2]